MSVGNRAYLKGDPPSKELIQAFRKVPAAMIGDCMNRSCALHYLVRLTSKLVKSMCGPALTVQSWGGGSPFFHKVLDMAQEGDVVVMAINFCNTNSAAGENIATNATFKRLESLVFDTSICNIRGISKMELPVYTADTTSGGPYKSAPGEISIPISRDSCFIYPGDIIVGDMDGVVTVPLGDAEAVLKAAQKYYVVDTHSQEEAAVDS